MLDAAGRCVVPGFVDSHTHLVFAGDRVEEFTARMAGTRYDAGGISATVAATRSASSRLLMATAAKLKREAEAQGTTTLETKSGYGLTVSDESRCLDVAETIAEEVTYLGAHVVAPEYRGREEDYVALVTGPMLEACAPKARWCDVFCETGCLRPRRGPGDPASRARPRARASGAREPAVSRSGRPARRRDGRRLRRPLHSSRRGGRRRARRIRHGGDPASRGRVLHASPYPDARRLLDAGVTVALATDCNPGTSYTTSMPFVIALAVREMHMTPDEALFAATAGGARALRRDDLGALAPGFRGDLVVLDAPSAAHLAYRPGVDLVAAVVRAGRLLG